MSIALNPYVSAALSALSPSQLSFLQSLPKAELHAHLNGCIPLSLLQQLAKSLSASSASSAQLNLDDLTRDGGVVLDEIGDFFKLFPAIYAITAVPENLALCTRAVLQLFLEPDENNGGFPQASYLELRSTPKRTPSMTRYDYVKTLLGEVEKYPGNKCALIVSLSREMKDEDMRECIEAAKRLKIEGRRVVGIDLCGDPWAGDMQTIGEYLASAKNVGLKVTLHIAETDKNPPAETSTLLSYTPDRLGHATFLDEATVARVVEEKIPIELCLSSNLLCKTVQTLDAHHIRHYLKHDHPISICTDDTLPFRNTLTAEYALLLAPRPVGLGLSEDEVGKVARMSMEARFA